MTSEENSPTKLRVVRFGICDAGTSFGYIVWTSDDNAFPLHLFIASLSLIFVLASYNFVTGQLFTQSESVKNAVILNYIF